MPERRRVCLIHDPDDHPLLTTWGWDTHTPLRTLIVRPTPGAKDQGTLTLDVMAALGKNPFPTQAPAPVAERWALCYGWVAADQISDIYVDRAHLLPVNHLLRLASLARTVGASLWLQWAAPNPDQAAAALDGDDPTRTPVSARVIHRFQAYRDLTERQHRYRTQLPPGTWGRGPRPWPTVPRADFPRFLAACREHLPPKRYARVLAEYRTAHAATRRLFPEPVDAGVDDAVHRARTIAHLRDDQLGEVTDPEQALIRLRAAQAALLHAGLLLCHHRSVAADPVALLPGAAPEGTHTAMGRAHHTGPPALLSLALHLGQDVGHLGFLRARDISADGSTLTLTPRTWAKRSHPYTVTVHLGDDHLAELAYAPVRFPPPARPLLAAHRAYRIAAAGRSTAWLFPSADDAKKPTSPGALRAAARDLARDIAANASWLKPIAGLPALHATWAGRRALTVDVLVPAPVPAGSRRQGW